MTIAEIIEACAVIAEMEQIHWAFSPQAPAAHFKHIAQTIRALSDGTDKQIDPPIEAAINAERRACFEIADAIRTRELRNFTGANPYHLIAEEIMDRIRARSES